MSNKKIINATPVTYEGITFRSTFERDVYIELKKNGFQPLYEAEKVILFNGFRPRRCWYENGEPVLTPKGNIPVKITDWIYKPDFILNINNYIIYIEVKGFPNDVYSYKRKLFLKYIDNKDALFFEIKNKKGLKQTIDLLKNVNTIVENKSQL